MPNCVQLILVALLVVGAAAPAAAQQGGADTLLNRFYGLREKEPAAARALLEEAVRRHPRDSRVQLEIGYLPPSPPRPPGTHAARAWLGSRA
jgi:hypothetical protein